MPWGKVDDKLHSSIKWRRASKGGRALWTTALSWCSSFPSDGKVPRDMLPVLDGSKSEADSLVRAGLWDPDDDGWIFHDWSVYNPDSGSIKASRHSMSKGGKAGNHARWHAKKGVQVPGCELCERSGGESGSDRPTR